MEKIRCNKMVTKIQTGRSSAMERPKWGLSFMPVGLEYQPAIGHTQRFETKIDGVTYNVSQLGVVPIRVWTGIIDYLEEPENRGKIVSCSSQARTRFWENGSTRRHS